MPEEIVHLLLIEDNPSDARLIRELLSEARLLRTELRWADRLVNGLAELAGGGVELVLADLSLPDSSGIETLERISAQAPDAAVIVLTGLDDEIVALELVGAGAEDYLVKGQFEAPLLERSIRYALERARSRNALRRSEERTRLTIDNALDGMIAMDGDAVITDWNPQAERLFGWAKDEVLGKALGNWLIPSRYEVEGSGGFGQYLRARGAAVLNRRMEHTGLRRSGDEFPIEWAIVPISTDANGGFCAFIRDITGRRARENEIRALNQTLEQRVWDRTAELQAANADLADREQALQDARESLDHVMTASPVVMYRTTLHNLVMTYVSPNVQEVFGYVPEELIGVLGFMGRQIHPDDVVAFHTSLAEAVSRNGPGYDESEFRLRHADGSYRWVHRTVRFDIDPDGKRLGAFGYLLDITERRRAEAELQEAKAEAERANEAKSGFLSRMSHELRTPLNAVLGFAQLMELGEHSDKDRAALKHIRKGGQLLLALVNEVLDITRIEADQLSIFLGPVSLRDSSEEALTLLRGLADERDIRVQVDAAAGWDRYVVADKQRLKQVLLNLVANAIKYNREGGSVTVSFGEQAVGRLRVLVTDTGPGIPGEKLDRLFTPFDRLGAERSAVEGTGLGLALSKRLVEAMQGTIGLESIVGTGTTFWLELPAADAPGAGAELVDTGRVAAETAVAGARTVLYVEDNLSNLELIEGVLRHRPQVRLICAMQGGLGLELAREHAPDLILLDLQLPDVPGAEVLRRLRADPPTRDIPVIVLSADATERQIDLILAAGAQAYLAKPIDVEAFLKLVDGLLAPQPV